MSEEKASERADGMEAALEVKAMGLESLPKKKSVDEDGLSNLTSSAYASGGEAAPAQVPALDESSALSTSSGDSDTTWTW